MAKFSLRRTFCWCNAFCKFLIFLKWLGLGLGKKTTVAQSSFNFSWGNCLLLEMIPAVSSFSILLLFVILKELNSKGKELELYLILNPLWDYFMTEDVFVLSKKLAVMTGFEGASEENFLQRNVSCFLVRIRSFLCSKARGSRLKLNDHHELSYTPILFFHCGEL